MTHQSAILDYASPRAPRGAIRLPARSVIDLSTRPDGSIHIVEQLLGKSGAIAAIVFSLLPLLTLGAAMRDPLNSREQIFLLAGLMLAEVLTMLAVINNTWRRTTLDVDSKTVNLRFFAPILGRARYEWASDRIANVEVQELPGSMPMPGRMLITIRDARPAALFDGHEASELQWIAGAIREALPRS